MPRAAAVLAEPRLAEPRRSRAVLAEPCAAGRLAGARAGPDHAPPQRERQHGGRGGLLRGAQVLLRHQRGRRRDCPGPPRRLSALSVFLCKSGLYWAFVWAHRALNSQSRRFPARAVPLRGGLRGAVRAAQRLRSRRGRRRARGAAGAARAAALHVFQKHRPDQQHSHRILAQNFRSDQTAPPRPMQYPRRDAPYV